MAPETPNSPPQEQEAPSPAPSSSSFEFSAFQIPSFSAFQEQLPSGIENHMEAFLVKSAIGAVGGAVAGVVLRTTAATGAAFGVGCAAGSFVERGLKGGEQVDPAMPKLEIPDIFSQLIKKD